MPTTITRLGPNSQALSYQTNTTIAEMFTALDAILLAQGWTVFDAAASVSAHCYRAPCADGTSAYKYMVVDLNSVGYLMCLVYESWNATSHVGTNLANNSNISSYAQRITLGTGGLVWIFATTRYAAFYSRTNNLAYGDASYSAFCGCFEISRDNADEVPGTYPLYAWVNGGHAMGSLADGANLHSFAYPRTTAGAVGVVASRYQTMSTIVGRNALAGGLVFRLREMIPNAVNGLSLTNNNYVFTPYAATSGTTISLQQIRGRFYGLKVLAASVGTPGDTIDIKCDSQLFLTGVLSDTTVKHMVLGASNERFALPL